MPTNRKALNSDLAKVDAYENTAADYDDIPALSEADFAGGVIEIGGRPKRGRPAPHGAKQQITLRLDPDIIAAYRESGSGWQGRVNEALRSSLSKNGTTGEQTPFGLNKRKRRVGAKTVMAKEKRA